MAKPDAISTRAEALDRTRQLVTDTATFHHGVDGELWRTEYVVAVRRGNAWEPVSRPFGRRADAEAEAARRSAHEPAARVAQLETEPGAFEPPPMH